MDFHMILTIPFYLEIAQHHRAILITDDADFGNYNSNVKIVTNNRKLLMFS